MAATLTSCASRKMLSSVCLLPIPSVFHCSMLNVLSDMVGVWAVVKVRVAGVASYLEGPGFGCTSPSRPNSRSSGLLLLYALFNHPRR